MRRVTHKINQCTESKVTIEIRSWHELHVRSYVMGYIVGRLGIEKEQPLRIAIIARQWTTKPLYYFSCRLTLTCFLCERDFSVWFHCGRILHKKGFVVKSDITNTRKKSIFLPFSLNPTANELGFLPVSFFSLWSVNHNEIMVTLEMMMELHTNKIACIYYEMQWTSQ